MKTLSIFLAAFLLFSCNSPETENAQNQTAEKKPFNRDSLITFIKTERDTLRRFAEKPFTPTIAGTLNYNRFRLFQKHFLAWQEYNFYPDVEPVVKEYGEVLKTAMDKTFPQIRKSYVLELERNGNYKDIDFEAAGGRSETLMITSGRFRDSSYMRQIHDRIRPQAERFRFGQLQYFGAEKPFMVNIDSFKDDSVVFTTN